jgi:hypothetical protein
MLIRRLKKTDPESLRAFFYIERYMLGWPPTEGTLKGIQNTLEKEYTSTGFYPIPLNAGLNFRVKLEKAIEFLIYHGVARGEMFGECLRLLSNKSWFTRKCLRAKFIGLSILQDSLLARSLYDALPETKDQGRIRAINKLLNFYCQRGMFVKDQYKAASKLINGR